MHGGELESARARGHGVVERRSSDESGFLDRAMVGQWLPAARQQARETSRTAPALIWKHGLQKRDDPCLTGIITNSWA